jgi:hypothetical protein
MGVTNRALGIAVAGLGLAGAAALGQDSEAPELDFLEYLGSWQETDEEWLIVAEWEDEDMEEQDDADTPERKDDE